MSTNHYRLKVLSVVNETFAALPKTAAVNRIYERWGYDHGQMVDPLWFGWPSKLIGVIKMVRELSDYYTHVMISDGADVIVMAPPDVVMARWEKFNHPWVFNAEPHIWSPGSFTPEQYPTPQCVYRYLNAGVSIGELAHVRHWFSEWTNGFTEDPQCTKGDQDWYAERFIRHYPEAMILDHNCELFQTGCGSRVKPDPILQFDASQVYNRLYNRVTRTYPLIVHANGGDDITTDPEWRLLWQ